MAQCYRYTPITWWLWKLKVGYGDFVLSSESIRLEYLRSPPRILSHMNWWLLPITVWLILVNNHPDALFQCIYLFHFSTCFEQPSPQHQENLIVSIHHLVYITLCRWLSGMPIPLHRHSRQWYISDDVLIQLILLMMSTGLLETSTEVK